MVQEYIIIQNKSVSERWQTTLIENKCSASGWFHSQTAHFLKKSSWKSLEIIEICTIKAQKGNKSGNSSKSGQKCALGKSSLQIQIQSSEIYFIVEAKQ